MTILLSPLRVSLVLPPRRTASFSVVGTNPITGTTCSVPGLPKVRVLFVEWMPPNTMGFSGVSPSSGIHNGRYRLKMNRVNTMAYSAKMIDHKIVRQSPDKHSVRSAVGFLWPVSWKLKASVALAAQSVRPQPTRRPLKANTPINTDLRKEPSQPFCINRKFVRVVGEHLSLLNRFNGLGFRGLEHREALSF